MKEEKNATSECTQKSDFKGGIGIRADGGRGLEADATRFQKAPAKRRGLGY